MLLTGLQLGRIHKAILTAYTRKELARVLLIRMDIEFEQVVTPGDFSEQVFELVHWANQREIALELLKYAHEENRTNVGLAELHAELVTQSPPQKAAAPEGPIRAAGPHQIFLSYSIEDAQIKDSLLADLRAAGLRVWTDDAIEPGTPEWWLVIEEALRSCKCFIVLLSPDAKRNFWVNREVSFANRLGRFTIPVLVRGPDVDAVPLPLIDTLYVDLRREYEEPVKQRLLPTLYKNLGIGARAPEIVRLQPPASPGSTISIICDALVGSYPTEQELREMVQVQLSEHLDHVAEGSNHAVRVFNLVLWAERTGRTAELIAAAYNHNSANSMLLALVQQALEWPTCMAAGLVLSNGYASAFAPRHKELAYLDGLLADYERWTKLYTPLAGVAEVAEQAFGRQDHSLHFLPPQFSMLAARDSERLLRRVAVDDLRAAVRQYGRVVLLGEPGSGKTVTLQMVRREYALAAKEETAALLPVFAPLGGYSGPESVLEYILGCTGEMGPHLLAYLHHGRALLLLDALNEMPQRDRGKRVERIQELLDQFPKATVVATCRALDYEQVEPLNLQKLEVKPLDVDRQRAYCRHYLGETDGDGLFWRLAGGEEVRLLWETWANAGGNWDDFWQADKMPDAVRRRTTWAQDCLWHDLREGKRAPLLALSVNPYMLAMLVDLYIKGAGDLPRNQAQVFAGIVAILLMRERDRRHKSQGLWPGSGTLRHALAELAFSMQQAGERGTAVELAWALAHLAACGSAPEEILYLAQSAALLDTTGGLVRFAHQSLQEYFAALAWQVRLAAGEGLSTYWPHDWINPTGWEETAVLLTGQLPDTTAFVEALLRVNPPLAARCIAESGGMRPGAETIREVQDALWRIAESLSAPVQERNAAGDALNYLGDPRPGVGVKDGVPDILWCDVPAGEFLMGSNAADSKASDDEKPQHLVHLNTFRISRYSVTNVQFQTFVDDGGYTVKWRDCWTEEGWEWQTYPGANRPQRFGGRSDPPNHAVVGVYWYEAVAFCAWLSRKLECSVLLPSEAQWEKAARGTDGRIWPWGNTPPTPDHCNFHLNVGTTTPVGSYPLGASPYSVLDMAGNVSEWTSTLFSPYPYLADIREELETPGTHMLRGGSLYDPDDYVRCAYRDYDDFIGGYAHIGFRVASLPS